MDKNGRPQTGQATLFPGADDEAPAVASPASGRAKPRRPAPRAASESEPAPPPPRGEPPSGDAWHSLLGKAALLRRMAPWEWLDESQVFMFEDPERGETHCVSLMGMLGEHLCLALYLGEAGWSGFVSQHDGSRPHPIHEVFESPHLQLVFEDRDQLAPSELALLKRLGIKVRGSLCWPAMRAFSPGRVPDPFTADDARLMEIAAELVLAAAPGAKGARRPFQKGKKILHFLFRDGNWERDWRVRPAAPQRLPEFALSETTRARLRAGRPVREVEAMLLPFIPMSFPHYAPARLPYLLLVCDAEGGFVFPFDGFLTPDPDLDAMRRGLPEAAAKMLIAADALPRAIRVGDPLLAAAFAPLGIPIEAVEETPACMMAFGSMMNALA